MDSKQPEDYVTWRLNLLKEDLNKMNDPNKKLYPVPPNNPWGIDPGLFPKGVTKDKYKKLVEGVVQRDMKKIREEQEVDKFINQMQGPSTQTQQTNKLMGNLDKISADYNREAVEDKQLFSDLDEIYIEYKGSYMKSMIQYIKYDRFLKCHKGDMAKAESCLYELKDYIQKLDTDKVTKTVREAADKAIENLLDHEKDMKKSVERINAGKKYFQESMRGLGLNTYESHGNFLHVKFDEYSSAIHAILEDKVYYRKDFTDTCLKGYSRFSSTTKNYL